MLPLKNIILERQLLRQLPYTSVRVPLCPKNGVHIRHCIFFMQSENKAMFLSKILYVRENMMKKYNIGMPEFLIGGILRENIVYFRISDKIKQS